MKKPAILHALFVGFSVAMGTFVAGCLAQPIDVGTGLAVGSPVTVHPLGPPPAVPTTNPATGSPVVLVPTNQVDYAAVQAMVTQAVQNAAPNAGPWAGLIGAAVAGGLLELARQRERKALNTPVPPQPPTPPKKE